MKPCVSSGSPPVKAGPEEASAERRLRARGGGGSEGESDTPGKRESEGARGGERESRDSAHHPLNKQDG